jgi:hypothetical protein
VCENELMGAFCHRIRLAEGKLRLQEQLGCAQPELVQSGSLLTSEPERLQTR